MFLPYHENLVEDKFCEMFKLSKNSDVLKSLNGWVYIVILSTILKMLLPPNTYSQ